MKAEFEVEEAVRIAEEERLKAGESVFSSVLQLSFPAIIWLLAFLIGLEFASEAEKLKQILAQRAEQQELERHSMILFYCSH